MENNKEIDLLDSLDLFEEKKEEDSLNLDILDFEIEDNKDNKEDILESENIDSINLFEEKKEETKEDILDFTSIFEAEISEVKNKTFFSKIKEFVAFVFRYIYTSGLIFGVLIVGTNYSAYYEIAKSYINADDLKNANQNMVQSLDNTKIQEEAELNSAKVDEDNENKNFHSMTKILNEANNEQINLDIDITPYENRIIIPKIAKNVPLLNVQNKQVTNVKELEDVFMEELTNGVVRYPGSGVPGENGNMFVFGHSSNFPWIKGDYNDVFALLDHVVFNDEIIVYYGQKKYIYKVREKKVIKPGEVSVLKRDNGKSEITLMTCYPVGTSINRLIIVGELVK
ncbi:MAG: sortase [Candidatus Gracilibacteria bacterium]|nr:sortase [Candidatus Gracilibacteria bacterium]